MKKDFFKVGAFYDINSLGNGIKSYQAHVMCKCTKIETQEDHDDSNSGWFFGKEPSEVMVSFKNIKVFNRSECTTWNIGKEHKPFSIRDIEFDKYKFKKITKEKNPEYFL